MIRRLPDTRVFFTGPDAPMLQAAATLAAVEIKYEKNRGGDALGISLTGRHRHVFVGLAAMPKESSEWLKLIAEAASNAPATAT